MIDFDLRVSGGEIGEKLSRNPEELGYALKALSENAADNLGTDVSHSLDPFDCQVVAEFLRSLADQIEAAA